MNTEKSKEDLFDPIEGLGELLSMPTEIKTNTDETVEIPVASWRMELQVVKSVGKLLGDVRQQLGLTWDTIIKLQKPATGTSAEDTEVFKEAELMRKEKLLDLILKIAELAPDEITRITATIVGKDIQFVEEKLELGVIIQVLLPFLLTRMTRLLKLMESMDVDFESATRKIRANLQSRTNKSPR